MSITKNKVVSLQYKVLDDQGEVIDSSDGGARMIFLFGANQVVSGLEEALQGKSIGDAVNATVPPAKGYGEYNEEAVQQVPRDAFEGVDVLEPGMTFTAQTEEGPVNLIVIEVMDDQVIVDTNHPLAGQTLTFEVIVEDVRDATEDELQQGQAQTAEASQ